MPKSKFWITGQKGALAEAAGLSPSHLSDILHRRRGVSLTRARKLEDASEDVLGYAIPAIAWLDNRNTSHPAFY